RLAGRQTNKEEPRSTRGSLSGSLIDYRMEARNSMISIDCFSLSILHFTFTCCPILPLAMSGLLILLILPSSLTNTISPPLSLAAQLASQPAWPGVWVTHAEEQIQPAISVGGLSWP